MVQSHDKLWRPRTDVDAEILRLIFDTSEIAAENHLDREELKACLNQVLSLPEEQRLGKIAEIFQKASMERRTRLLDEEGER